MTTKVKSNGKAPQSATSKQAPALSKVMVPDTNSIEQRLQKVTELKHLADKRHVLTTKRAQIREFQFGGDEHSSQLVIADSSGREFKTQNANLINLLVSNLEQLIEERLNELDLSIMKYEL